MPAQASSCESKQMALPVNVIIDGATPPFFTTAPGDDRSGMGFTVMESFMDDVQVHSAPGQGTVVHMSKALSLREAALPRRA